jgi:hypothetical protein
VSEIVKLKGGIYEYKIPSPPSREEDILFIKEKKKDQYWRTQTLPDMKRMGIKDKVRFIDREHDRWLNGVHFMNNGELTYINGMNYDHLTYMTFDRKKAFYLDNQRLDFYFRQLRWESPKCKGSVIAKGRRVGASMEELTEATYRLTEDFSRHVGLISIEEKKTKRSLFNPIVDSFIQRPKFMRPTYYRPNGRKPKQSLQLSSDEIPLDSDTSPDLDKIELGGWMLPATTSVSAFDAFIMQFLTADEIWKWKNISPREFLETQLPCFEDGGNFFGAISLLSTLGDTDDVMQAILDGIYIYQNSDPRNLLEDGFTQTGLWNWFISAIYAERDLKDKYGKINEDQATAKIMAERSKYEEGSIEYIHQIRRKPLTEEEAMATAEGSSTFDNVRLQDRITVIEKLPVKEKPYLRGELHEDSTTGKVHFEPTDKGYWLVSILPKKERLAGKDFSNRWTRDDNGIYHMNKSPEGSIGYDPIRYGDKQTVSKNISKSAIIARYKFDYFDNKDRFGRSCAGRYAGLYINRDEDPDAAHFEFFKAMKLWGFPGMYERQVEAVLKFIREVYALNFLLKSKGKYGLWTDNQQKVIKKGIDRFQSLIKRPKIGSDEIDRLKDVPFEELLKSAKRLDPNNTRPEDVFMANTMLEHADELITYTDLIDELMESFDENDNALLTLFGR